MKIETKICKRCKKEQELTNFYFKSGYYRNICKTCEKKEHKVKYKQGDYKYDYEACYDLHEYSICTTSNKLTIVERQYHGTIFY